MQPPGDQHGEQAADRECLPQVVRDVHHCQTLVRAEPAQQVLQPVASVVVDGAERLVEKQHPRSGGECPRECDPLALAARNVAADVASAGA